MRRTPTRGNQHGHLISYEKHKCMALRKGYIRPKPYNNYVAMLCDIIDNEPSTCEEVTENKEWKDSMIEEYWLIMNNDAWEIVLRPEGKYFVTSNWIYMINHDENGSIEKDKEIFVERGFSQKEGIDYEETFPPVAGYTSIRSMLALVTVMKCKVH